MPEGYITESEVTYLNSKLKQTEKFNEVFKFYHETVPKEAVVVKETDTKVDEVNTGVQTLDSATPEQKQEPEQKTES